MMDEIELFWHPASNKLFTPLYTTTYVEDAEPPKYAVAKYRPIDALLNKGVKVPFFEAVLIASFDVWDLVCVDMKKLFMKFADPEAKVLRLEDMRTAHKEFIKQNPSICNASLASDDECVEGVPREAIYVPEA